MAKGRKPAADKTAAKAATPPDETATVAAETDGVVNLPVVHGRFGFFSDAGEAARHLPQTDFKPDTPTTANGSASGGDTETNFKKAVGTEVERSLKATVEKIVSDVDKRIAENNGKQNEETSASVVKLVSELLPVALADFFANVETVASSEGARTDGKTGLFKLPSGFLVII